MPSLPTFPSTLSSQGTCLPSDNPSLGYGAGTGAQILSYKMLKTTIQVIALTLFLPCQSHPHSASTASHPPSANSSLQHPSVSRRILRTAKPSLRYHQKGMCAPPTSRILAPLKRTLQTYSIPSFDFRLTVMLQTELLETSSLDR